MAESNSFTSHFVELRTRLLHSLIFIFFVFIVSYIFAEHIYNFLVEPYAKAVKDDCLLYTSPSPRDKRQSRMPSSA